MYNQNNMQTDSSTKEYVNERFQDKSRSVQRITLSTILRKFLIFLVLSGFVIGFYYYVDRQLIEQSEVLIEDVDRYGGHLKYVNFEGLKIFPSYNKGEAISYLFYKHQSMFDNTFQVAFACQYDLKTFQEEIERIRNLYVKQDDGTKLHPIYKTDLFELPVYIMTFNDQRTYEYVMIDEVKRRLVYVYLRYYDDDNIRLHQDYLPEKYDAIPPLNIYLGVQ